jgi:GT2 family glycosyltransferase
MDISVVVPTFNRREIVGRSLETLFAQSLEPARFEIIVVVDGSTDGTAESLKEPRPACGFRVIEQENRGLAGARNTGYRAAETGLVLFLDDDMLCDRNLVAAHLAAHKAAERMVAFGAIFLSSDSRMGLAAECFNREIGAFHLAQKRAPGGEWKATDCVFSNSSISRDLLVEAEGFDESFRMREDLELGVRLFSAGVRSHYIADAIAYQYYEKSCADLIRDAEAFAEADAKFARKHPEVHIKGQLTWLRQEPAWKQRLRQMAAFSPSVGDILLAPVCGAGDLFFRVPAMRNLGVRALQIRRRIHWIHRLIELGAYPAEARKK